MSGQPKDGDEVIRAGDVKPGEPPRIYLTRYGVVVNDEHGVVVHANDGSTTTLRADSSIEVRNPKVRRIEIDDALAIVDFQMVRMPDTTSYVIEFEGGGVFAYLRDAQGKVIEMTQHGGVHTKADFEGNLRVFARAPTAPEGGTHA